MCYPNTSLRLKSSAHFSSLTSGLQVCCGSPVLHPELSGVGGVLEGGQHVGAQLPVAAGRGEEIVT